MIKISNWAGCASAEVPLEPGHVTILSGPVASGKSSALTAIRALTRGLPTGSLSALLRSSKEPTIVTVEGPSGSIKIGLDGKTIGKATKIGAGLSGAELAGYGPDLMRIALAGIVGIDVSVIQAAKPKAVPKLEAVLPVDEARAIVFRCMVAAGSGRGKCPIDGSALPDATLLKARQLSLRLGDPKSPESIAYRDALQTLLKAAQPAKAPEGSNEDPKVVIARWDKTNGPKLITEINARLAAAARSLRAPIIPVVSNEYTIQIEDMKGLRPFKGANSGGGGGASGGERACVVACFDRLVSGPGAVLLDDSDIAACDPAVLAGILYGMAGGKEGGANPIVVCLHPDRADETLKALVDLGFTRTSLVHFEDGEGVREL